MRVPSDGGTPEQLWEGLNDVTTILRCPFDSGSSCILSRRENDQLVFYAFDPRRGQDKSLTKTQLAPTAQTQWSISPSGDRIAPNCSDLLEEQIRILDLQKRSEKTIQLPKNWVVYGTTWTADGNALLASVSVSPANFLARVELDGKTNIVTHAEKHQLFDTPIVSRDGHYLAYGRQVTGANAWLLENF